MYKVGLLILTSRARWTVDHLSSYIKYVSSMVSQRLYVKHEPNLSSSKLSDVDRSKLTDADRQILQNIPRLYANTNKFVGNLDIRILQASCKSLAVRESHINSNFDVVLTDSNEDERNIALYVKEVFNKVCPVIVKIIPTEENQSMPDTFSDYHSFSNVYRTSVLGGTFDRLHSGHKVLLSEALLRTTEKLIIGITDGAMLHNKVLWQLIEPVERRIDNLKDFLFDIDPTVNPYIVPIYDIYGPSVQFSDIDCIVVSEETVRGADKVNAERIKRGYEKLDIHVIPLVEDCDNSPLNEVKISSSTIRLNLLGTLLNKPRPKPHLPTKPYVIGLLGGVSNGSSLVADLLQSLQVPVIDCDEILCCVCSNGTLEFDKMVEEFGNEISPGNGKMDYFCLAKKVLQTKDVTTKVTSLLQIKLESVIQKKILLHREKGDFVVALKAPSIVSWFWEPIVHEIWAVTTTMSKAVENLKSNYTVSDEEALTIASSEFPTCDIINQCNVVLSTTWDKEFTRKQVQNALQHIKSLLKENEEGSSQLL